MIAPLFLAAVTVLLPDGSPAAGAHAASLAQENFVHVVGTAFARPKEPVAVGEEAKLEVTPETAGRWIILHEQGWADLEITPETDEVRLEPWLDVAGTVLAAHEPEALVSFHRTDRPFRQGDRGSIFWTSTTPIQSDGSYSLRHLPQGHGSVGLLRVAKNERRIQRWRDYVRFVDVPSPGPANLDGGTEVSGRIMAEKLPAIVALASRGPEPTCHGLTDAEGRFTIPGVLPGAYRLTARPDLGSATINLPQREIIVGTEPLDLGELSGSEPEVEIDSRVELFEGLLERIRSEATNHSALPIENIWIGELSHPLGNYGARITFQPQPDPDDPTHATRFTLLLHIPGEPFRKFYPAHDSLGWGFRFTEGDFEKVNTFENKMRVFPLSAHTLFPPINDDVSYDDALALLRAIEAGEIQHPKPQSKKTGPNTQSFSTIWSGGNITVETLPQITGIQSDKDGQIKIQTRNRPFGGRFYHFQKRPDGHFEQTGGGGWVS